MDFADGIIDRIFAGKYKNVIVPEMMLETFKKLWNAVRADWGKTEDINLASDKRHWLNRVHNNIHRFSAAKNFTQMMELNRAVFDKDGKTLPYTQFRAKAKTIVEKYNEHYLETEYHAVTRAAIMGRKWLDIQRDKDIYPYLEYVTARDSKVRKSHQALDGKIFHVDSPFWKQYYPPNGWLCRCTVKQLRGFQTESNLKDTLETANASTDEYWQKNVGEEDIFGEDETAYFNGFPKTPLEAVKHYGLQKASRISNRADLTPLSVEPASVTETMNFKPVSDYDGLIVGKHPSLNTKHLRHLENLASDPDEVWTNDTVKYYIKYHKDTVLIMLTNADGNAIAIDAISYDAIETYRKGILNHLKQKSN